MCPEKCSAALALAGSRSVGSSGTTSEYLYCVIPSVVLDRTSPPTYQVVQQPVDPVVGNLVQATVGRSRSVSLDQVQASSRKLPGHALRGSTRHAFRQGIIKTTRTQHLLVSQRAACDPVEHSCICYGRKIINGGHMRKPSTC
jgi:hypothetical protein